MEDVKDMMGRLARISIEILEKEGRNCSFFKSYFSGFISVYFDNSCRSSCSYFASNPDFNAKNLLVFPQISISQRSPNG